MGLARLIASFADGDDAAVNALDAAEIRALLDELDPIQRDRESRIQALASERRSARDGRADALRAEQDGITADQRVGAEFRRALKRRLAEITIDARIEVGRTLAVTLVRVLGEVARLNAGLEVDGLTDDEIDDHLSEIERAEADLDGQIPHWRELAS